MDRESEGKGRIKRKKGEKEKDICEKWHFYPSLSFSLSLSLYSRPHRSIFET